MAQTEAEFKAAYDAGYQDRDKERDYDPGNSMPDDVLGMPNLDKPVPVYVPDFENGHRTDGLLGRVMLYGRTAILTLPEGEEFQRRLTQGAYIGMTVQFPVGFQMKDLDLDNEKPPTPKEILNENPDNG